ncbi:MAG: nickel-dependent hydrogenase large subunit [Candidatus Zixiibacteriota bacterium]|nr:MAG: nickel-dependent hydrogenase large subunit [candidate division Zixibacteria bacterium]
MSTTITLDPITRIEGHLKVEIEVDGGEVTDARCSGEMFRGLEKILIGRNPVDANQITQRICGVCPAGHAQASSLTLDSAFGVTPPENGRLIRNLVLGSNYLQSHILHFYHLAALDFVDITAILNYTGSDSGLNRVKDWAKSEVDLGVKGSVAPFLPRYEGDYATDAEFNLAAISHYLKALEIRRKAHEMLAIFGGRMPHAVAIVPGGCSENVTVKKILAFSSRLREIQDFVENVYIPDVLAVAGMYASYFGIGKGCGNLLAYGVFEENESGSTKLLPPGTYINGKVSAFSEAKIAEHVKHSRYSSTSKLHPSKGETSPDTAKGKAYSWLKAPRYDGHVTEVGSLARVAVAHLTGSNTALSEMVTGTLDKFSAPVTALFSVLGRHAARALESKLVADRCAEWVGQLKPGKPVHTAYKVPKESTGVGLTEAPRGALGHWISIKGKRIDRYQCVVPTTWNAGPRDDKGNPGPMEQALIGTPIADAANPIEAARVVRSFDPCIACAVHVMTPDRNLVSQFRVV